ncbi:MAG: hypothetical protein ABIQ16_13755 [Polyangiaceae bacterium]
MSNRRAASLSALTTMLLTGFAHAQATAPDARDHFQLSARSETYVELFQRALKPGPNGALVSTDTAAPFQQYLFVRASDLDVGPHADSLDFEVAAWGRLWFGARQGEPLVDADLQTANARYHHGPIFVRLGRQVQAGGAARYLRFDGISAGADLGAGLSAEAYGGLTVLPRWNRHPGYEQLGASVDTLLKNPEALPDPKRADYRAAGGRVAWASLRGAAGVSFLEQREPGGLAHRNLGIDARVEPISQATLGGTAVLDLDRVRFSDARVWGDARPFEDLLVSLEYLHTEPSLFLSHQSVLSVFGSANYDEAGTLASWRCADWLSFDGAAFVDFYGGNRPGGRAEGGTRFVADRHRLTTLRIAYARVLTAENGYHSLRSSLTRSLMPKWSATVEAYAYLYDHAIRSSLHSVVYASTLTFEPSPALSVLVGGSLASTPYASFDAQAQARVVYSFDAASRRGQR